MAQPEVSRAVLRGLLERTRSGQTITLDELAEALGAHPFTPSDIAELIQALARHDRRVVCTGGAAVQYLKTVLVAVRTLKAAGLRPTARAVAERANMPLRAVQLALSLAAVMQLQR